MMVGRRWSDGLHQAVEAKEGVTVKGETQTLATVTIQNYFRMYEKLAGMTGTAETEEGEFHTIYKLDVMVIPTNRPVVREDRHDLVYKTKREKYNAIIEEIERLYTMQLPVLVGTVSVDVSETISRMLKRRGIPHEVLNAKYHGREAQIVAEAGRAGAVTIATNMAGRGTDIKLGEGVKEPRLLGDLRARGVDLAKLEPRDPALAVDFDAMPDDYVVEVGGLHIIGSERHESRRIDRQLRGRAGRQGDPGASEFFLSLEDDLMRLFGSDRIASVMDRMGAEEGEVISHSLITRSIGNAQKRVEMQNFEARKRLLDYDDVMNQQREVIYDLRTFALEGGEDLKGETWDMVEKTIGRLIDEYAHEGSHPEDWDIEGLRGRLELDFFLVAPRLPREDEGYTDLRSRGELEEYLLGLAREKFRAQLAQFGDHSEDLLRYVVLSTIDERWKDHLYDLDGLKASIGFRGWGQKDPLIEYKQEAYDMFVGLMTDIHSSIARLVFRARLEVAPMPTLPPLLYTGPELEGYMESAGDGENAPAPPQRPREGERSAGLGVNPRMAVRPPQPPPVAPQHLTTNRDEARHQPTVAPPEVGRNDLCPCGSGKKYKKCHGR
jgi:preprotein translocase subunit SecA